MVGYQSYDLRYDIRPISRIIPSEAFGLEEGRWEETHRKMDHCTVDRFRMLAGRTLNPQPPAAHETSVGKELTQPITQFRISNDRIHEMAKGMAG